MTFMTHNNPPAFTQRPIRNCNDATVLLRSKDYVLSGRWKLLQKAFAAFIAAVFRTLNTPDGCFDESGRTAEEGFNLPGFFHGETDCMLCEEGFNLCII